MSLFDLQPPSPSLSPNSKIRHYQQQLDNAHYLIDHLEMILAEREEQKQNYFHNGVFIPALNFHHSNSPYALSERSKSYVATPQQYSTPRDLRARSSMGCHMKYIEEMKVRHSALLLQSTEEMMAKEQKNKEILDNIQELKTELVFSQEKQVVIKKQKQQTGQEFERILQEIERVKAEITKSKEQGSQLSSKLQELKNEQVQSEDHKIPMNVEQQSPVIKLRLSHKQSTSQKKQLASLKKEIQLLETQKQEHFSAVKQFEEKEVEVDVVQIQEDPLVQKNENHRIDTLDDMRLVTESELKINTQQDENQESLKSFIVRKQKHRGCESCNCF